MKAMIKMAACKWLGIFGLLSMAMFVISSCDRQKQWQTDEGAVWSTTYHITYQSDLSLTDSIQEVFRSVDESLSAFNPNSVVSRINRSETSLTDSLFREVFRLSQRVNDASEGRFDPTVSPLVNIWGFGYDKKAQRYNLRPGEEITMDKEIIDSALTLVGINDCYLRGDTLFKKRDATSFNFSAVAKGFGCDVIAEMLRRNGVEDYMVEIGGEIAVAGKNPRGKHWSLRIDSPGADLPGKSAGVAQIHVTDCGIATSGNYRNYYDTPNMGRIAHTISPQTGYPVQTEILSATVVAPDCATADAWATACMASTVAEVEKMLAGHRSLSAMLVVADADTMRTLTVGSFPPFKR